MRLELGVGWSARSHLLFTERFAGQKLATSQVYFFPIWQSVPVVDTNRIPVTTDLSSKDFPT
jgi:hypothetical protein